MTFKLQELEVKKPHKESDVIKKPHVKTDYSEEQLLELMRCQSDPMYFMTKFMKVQHPILGAIDFIPYDYQVKMVEAMHGHKNSIIMTARQSGKTTVASGYIAWRAMFVPDSLILIVANKVVQALEVVNKVRFCYENLPDYIRAGVTEYNKGNLSFDNGSRIISRATAYDAGRGMAVSLLYCLAGETSVTVRDKNTGKIMNISLEDLYELLEE